jgi:glycosyltransferase involved in cell wall biosynthesis
VGKGYDTSSSSCHWVFSLGGQDVEYNVELSVVVPVFNEADNLDALYKELSDALYGLQYELLFVDDGSTDESYARLADLHAKDQHVKAIRLAGNFGQHAALSAGIERARGQAIVSLDADLQCDPHDIPKLVAKIQEGYDVVSGRRDSRKDPLLRRLTSYVANKTIGMVTGVRLHDYGCPLKVMTADVGQNLKHYGEMRRFLGALVVQVAKSVGEVEVSHRSRVMGKSRYSILRLIGHYLDFLVSFPTRPFQIVGIVGSVMTLFGLVSGALYFPLRLLANLPLGGRFQILVFLTVFFGLQFAILGLLGEFTTRIYRLVQHRPFFVIKETLE